MASPMPLLTRQRKRLPSSHTHAVVICAGNANACTGEQGLTDANRMTELTAAAVGCQPQQVLVCSTGVIGVPLPMSKVETGIRKAQSELAATPEALSSQSTFQKASESRRCLGAQVVRDTERGRGTWRGEALNQGQPGAIRRLLDLDPAVG